ncbi:hypothetical protein [Saccharothrix xinjiangensis]|uniref:Membrane protein (TIGR02234 family) n=1 Tax=Saccharothrix xinjiangensis TaxID=204798 RepID=A0ABV9YA57_9PSEU
MNRRLLGAALLVLAAAGAVVGTFLPLTVLESGFGRGDEALRITTTSWAARLDPAQVVDLDFGRTPQYGVPIVVAGLLLAVAAAMVFLPEHQRGIARYTALGATGVLVGAVWAVWSAVSAALRGSNGIEREYLRETAGAGIWLLSAAVLVAVAGLVLVHARRSTPRPGGAVVYAVGDADEDTPPFGIPVVEVARLPESDYAGPADPAGTGPVGSGSAVPGSETSGSEASGSAGSGSAGPGQDPRDPERAP